jgi:glycosyltransferase involved in cell wall biosynthesis
VKQITEVTVYTNGPAGEYKTWSNVPYFFTEALRRRGIKVNSVNINPYPFIEWIYNRTIRLVWKFIHRRTTYAYFRSGLRHWITNILVQKAITQYPNSQADIFLTFSFSTEKRSSRPVILLSDWPFRYAIEYFQNRPPDLLEAGSIKREDTHIEKADLVISLFRSAADIMKQKYQNENIYCIGQAINIPSMYENDTLPARKAESFNLLFIGDAKYAAGLRILILAYMKLKESFPELTLAIVGHDTSYLEPLPDGVISYGYLDKGKEASRTLFYSLMVQARVLVNTTPKWGGFSSILEAMECYTPVIVAPFHEIIELFGKTKDFIIYCEENTPDVLAGQIKVYLEHPDYASLARNAHAAVHNLTWNNYVGMLLTLMETKL